MKELEVGTAKYDASIYHTLKGGWCGMMWSDGNGNIRQPKVSDNYWQYMFGYGIFRICKGHPNLTLTIPGNMGSLHINTYSVGCWLPKCLKNRATDFHIAFLKKFPFVIFGLKNIKKYTKSIGEE